MATYNGQEFENACVERIAKIITDNPKDWNHTKFAGIVFGEGESGVTTWRTTRKGGRRFSIAELVDGLNAMCIKPASFFFEIQEILAARPAEKKERSLKLVHSSPRPVRTQDEAATAPPKLTLIKNFCH